MLSTKKSFLSSPFCKHDHKGIIIKYTTFSQISTPFFKISGFWIRPCIKVHLYNNFFTIFLKLFFHVNGVNNCFIILCIFHTVSFWRPSTFFPSFIWNQNRFGSRKILEIKLYDKHCFWGMTTFKFKKKTFKMSRKS